MSYVIFIPMSGAGVPYQSSTINNGGAIVASPIGSGFLDTNYTSVLSLVL